MQRNTRILSIALLIASLAYTLWFVFAGFGNHQDPLYWLYKYEHLEGGWLAFGTLLTGGVLVKLFGAQLLPLRIAGWLCTIGAIFLPYCCLLTKVQRRDNLHWLALTILLMGYGAFQEFSPGTLSVLLLSALWVTQSPVIAGLAISARFPNILVLLLLVPLWKKKSLWNIPITMGVAGVVYGVGCLFITPAPIDAAMSSHDFLPMITKLWESGGKLMGFMLMTIAVLGLHAQISNLKYKISSLSSGLLVGLVLCYVIFSMTRPTQWYNRDLTYMLCACCLVIALGAKSKTIYWGTAMVAIATLGTDTGWLKLFPAVLCLLPVAAVEYEAQMKRYLWCVLVVMSSMVVWRMVTNSVGQSNLTQVQTFCSVSPYHGIAVRQAEEQRLLRCCEQVDSLHANYPSSTILALGQDMHLMRAITGCEAARYNEFWSNIFDSVYTAKYQQVIESEYPIVLCTFSPQFKTKPAYKDRESRMEHMLLEHGYEAKDCSNDKYMIYIPKACYDKEVQ